MLAMGETYSSEVHIPTYSGEVYGTLSYKSQINKNIAVLLIADAGGTDRNGNSEDGFNNSNCLKNLADQISHLGIACLRYDKRGTGKSQLSVQHPSELRLEDYVDDAIHCIQFLKTQLRYSNVIVVGHGEGSLIGMLAAQRTNTEGFVSIAAPAKGAATILHEQLQQRLSGSMLAEAKSILEQLSDGRIVDAVCSSFTSLFNPEIQPYLISLFRYQPAQEIAKLTIPVLILHGTRDLQVPLCNALELKENAKSATLTHIDGMSHVLKQANENSFVQVDCYNNPSLPISKTLLANLLAFIGNALEDKTVTQTNTAVKVTH
jgi:pimeloyl-ACP methyl ester carboxylesterase